MDVAPTGSALDLEAALIESQFWRQSADEPKADATVSINATALDHYRILFPELISYRGGLFREEAFDQAIVDDMLMFAEGNDVLRAAEKLLNTVNLSEADAPFDSGVTRAVAETIAFNWRCWIRERFGRVVNTYVLVEAEDLCEVWFETAPEDAG